MDALGNLTQVTEPRPGGGSYTTSYYYNPTGKLIRVEMPRDGVTQVRTFIYDSATQRLMSATNPETGVVTYAYNADGTLKSKTDAKGYRTENTYDDKQRVTMVQVFNAQNVEMQNDRKTYAWDVEDDYTQNGMGRVGNEATGVNPSYLHRYSYTPSGLVTAKRLEFTGVPNAADMEGTYGYDNEGRMTSEGTPGYSVMYEYDSMGRMSQMKQWMNYQWQVLASASYGVAGEVLSLSYFGTNETRQYNERFQMTRQTVYGVMDMEYRYSPTANNGRIISQKDNVSGEEVAYYYDELNRLISAISSGWSQSYTYDGFGNKLTHTGMASLSYTNNQINGIHGWLYDLNGNATVMPWATLAYDGFNRAATATTSSGLETYGYAPDNKRVMRQRADGVYEFYFYNVRGERVTTFSNNQFTSNYYFLGRLVKAGNDTVVTDRLGSVRNKGGANSRYYPYGEEQVVTASNRDKFATYYRDQATNLDYADQRYYASGFGRFLTADPYRASAGVRDPGSWNRYAYVQGDPVNCNDPSGLRTEVFYEDGGELVGEWIGDYDGEEMTITDSNGNVTRLKWNSSTETWEQPELQGSPYTVPSSSGFCPWSGVNCDSFGNPDYASSMGLKEDYFFEVTATGVVQALGGVLTESISSALPYGIRFGLLHGPHHRFPGYNLKLPHLQINLWKKGVESSGRAYRLPISPKIPFPILPPKFRWPK